MADGVSHEESIAGAVADLATAIRTAETALASAVDAVANLRGAFWRLLILVQLRRSSQTLLEAEGIAALKRIRAAMKELRFMKLEMTEFERSIRLYQKYDCR
jgi:hypothetical protein